MFWPMFAVAVGFLGLAVLGVLALRVFVEAQRLGRQVTDSARRINRAAPEQSLMLLKLSGVVPHVGGVLSQPGESCYEMIRSWIAGHVRSVFASINCRTFDAEIIRTFIRVKIQNAALPKRGSST